MYPGLQAERNLHLMTESQSALPVPEDATPPEWWRNYLHHQRQCAAFYNDGTPSSDKDCTCGLEGHFAAYFSRPKVAASQTLRAQVEQLTRYANNGEVIHYRGNYGEFILREDVLALIGGDK